MEYVKLSPKILKEAVQRVNKFYKDNNLKYNDAYGFMLTREADGMFSVYFGKEEEKEVKQNFFTWMFKKK